MNVALSRDSRIFQSKVEVARILAFLLLALPTALSARLSTADLVVLPATTTQADIYIELPNKPSTNPQINLLPLVDKAGKLIVPQPEIKGVEGNGGKYRISMTGIYFWEQALLQVQVPTQNLSTYTLQRGPSIEFTQLQVSPSTAGEFWLYNFETRPISFTWRIVSGSEVLSNRDGDAWLQGELGPVRSQSFQFIAPASWFNLLSPFFDDQCRSAELQLRFGSDSNAPFRSVPLKVRVHSSFRDTGILTWISESATRIRILFAVMFWVTVGAVLLMLAQVMVPNFRNILRMESQIDALQERLRAVSSRVSDRLYTRCQQELQSVRVGLAMPQTTRAKSTVWWDRLALAGNTSEIMRLGSVLAKIETRVRLTELLDQAQIDLVDIEVHTSPPSVCWTRAKQLRSAQAILSRQLITDSDEKIATASLDFLSNAAVLSKPFLAELETRVAAVRRFYSLDPWKTNSQPLLSKLPGCSELVADKEAPTPPDGWATSEIIFRDLTTIRLEIIQQLMLLGPLVKDPMAIVEQIRSPDAYILEDARLALTMLAEGISLEDVRKALEAGLWDTISEPSVVTDQDVVRMSLKLRDERIDRSAAKSSFKCSWRVSTPQISDIVYEGWEVQFLPSRGKTSLRPEVYDRSGEQIIIDPGLANPANQKTPKGQDDFDVTEASSNGLSARLMRGLIDAAITATVPVFTVALTQLYGKDGAVPGMKELVILGFTSQAIRSAIIPSAGRVASVTSPSNPSVA